MSVMKRMVLGEKCDAIAPRPPRAVPCELDREMTPPEPTSECPPTVDPETQRKRKRSTRPTQPSLFGDQA